ncbi:Aryl-alcohol dehydrogenase [Fusarium pseudocircinatum]|uniref:Aryl-alcohol dehydrogenase n=1 Tax=Fusarium pseudocircinatum TaxID=56676 RepID=A0A8H5KZL2_9HYPO|nr:Aryl-alcohol dehydrogenase [Fusarium pseudocircinatum]
MAAAPLIKLSDMAQRKEIRTASEDWTGITSTAKRRKLQNRLNQRAYERRKASRRSASLHLEQGSRPRYVTMATGDTPDAPEPPYPTQTLTMIKPPVGCTPRPGCILLRPDAQGAIRQFVKKAYEDYVLGCPQPWYLSTLIQVNVFNALVQNGIALGFSDRWQRKDVISPFSITGPLQSCDSYPPNLQPTALQRTVPHHPWIDLFPIPQMRDNILLSLQHLDMDELCSDLLDVKPGLDEKPSLVVWGDPWDLRGWEASALFLQKWGWMLEGCRDIFQATNYWRQSRGEDKILF